ncbi:ycf20-like protein [Hevea brasiliensis]|uniref:ycf20-like protein n=1 Tax=Hevea brasiliensis TaxID=3981 RepID=UPI0025EEE3AC|nr:ycf20-like protein [Hevea brasiliensis]
MCAMQNWSNEPNFSVHKSKVGIKSAPLLRKRNHANLHHATDSTALKQVSIEKTICLGHRGLSGNSGEENFDGDSPPLQKLNSARKNFPMKIFLLLLGFYTANALATIIGQTGDWDVLLAGVVVAATEGIGMLMCRKPSSLSAGRLQSFVVLVNYWKAGVCLGLFVDAFKLGS